MDDTCFDLLCKDLTADEAKVFRKMMAEWSNGDENGFPVQFALLTRVQWHAAALVPQAVNESRKLIELHLAEYRRQIKVMMDDFSSTAQKQTEELNTAVENHAKTTGQATGQIQLRLADAETVAKRIKTLMESSASEWRGIKASTTAQCERLERISNDLQDRFTWRVLLRSFAWFLLALGYGICIGHYWIR